jgi:hypothetical protein
MAMRVLRATLAAVALVGALAVLAACGGGETATVTREDAEPQEPQVEGALPFEPSPDVAAAASVAAGSRRLLRLLEAAPCSWRPRLERMRRKGGLALRRIERLSAAELEAEHGISSFDRDRPVATGRAELDLMAEWLRYCEEGGIGG